MYIDGVYRPFFDDVKDPVVIDAGANIGVFTLYAYPIASKIYSIEPSQTHYDTFIKMLEYNEMMDKVVPIRVALANTEGEAEFYHPINPTARSLSKMVETISKDKEIVNKINMDTLFTQYKIDHVDFLKLDVEGSEFEIIEGATFEKVCPKIDSLVVEWHAWSQYKPEQLYTALSDYGYKVFPIGSGNVTLFGAKRNG